MKRLFAMVWVFVFMAITPLFHAVADNNPCRNLVNVADKPEAAYGYNSDSVQLLNAIKNLTVGQRYTISANYKARYSGGAREIRFRNGDTVSSTRLLKANQDGSRQSQTFVLTQDMVDATRAIVYFGNTNDEWNETGYLKNVQIEEGSTATEYTPYNPLCATCNGIIQTSTNIYNNNIVNITGVTHITVQKNEYGFIATAGEGTLGSSRVALYFPADMFEENTSYIISGIPSSGTGGIAVGKSPYGTTTDFSFYKNNTSNIFKITNIDENQQWINIFIYLPNASAGSVFDFSNFQIEKGTVATPYHPYGEYCKKTLKIATTAYNTAQFNPVVTDLNTTIATIRDVVTNTINQTAAIADLQAKKQTRPDEQCPAGKKCLLVETEENGVIVPHWYPIIEAPED